MFVDGKYFCFGPPGVIVCEAYNIFSCRKGAAWKFCRLYWFWWVCFTMISMSLSLFGHHNFNRMRCFVFVLPAWSSCTILINLFRSLVGKIIRFVTQYDVVCKSQLLGKIVNVAVSAAFHVASCGIVG